MDSDLEEICSEARSLLKELIADEEVERVKDILKQVIKELDRSNIEECIDLLVETNLENEVVDSLLGLLSELM